MRRVLISLFTLGLLAACTVTIPPIDLPEQKFSLTAPNTGGMVIYKKEPLTFDPPPVQALKVVITGKAELSPHTPLSLDVYARLSKPSSCDEFYGIYICDVSQEDTHVGQIDLSTNSTTSFTLGQEGGETLAQGVNQGQFWLGFKVGGTGSSNSTLTLRDMKATVTVRLF